MSNHELRNCRDNPLERKVTWKGFQSLNARHLSDFIYLELACFGSPCVILVPWAHRTRHQQLNVPHPWF